MVKLFNAFRSKSHSEREHAPPHVFRPAPGTSIYYDPELIPKLKKDHSDLLNMYNRIDTALSKEKFESIPQLLSEFRSGLQAHLLVENVRLYVYLRHQLATNMETADLINGFSREMEDIGRVVMGFIRKYSDSAIDATNVAAFTQEFKGIGAALVKRIQREENDLYSLYMPSY